MKSKSKGRKLWRTLAVVLVPLVAVAGVATAASAQSEEPAQSPAPSADSDRGEVGAIAEAARGARLSPAAKFARPAKAVSNDVVLELLDLSAEEVRDALQNGSTLAELAEANGVSQQDLIDTIVGAIEDRAAEHDKDLSEDDIAEIREKIRAMVNGELNGDRARARQAERGDRSGFRQRTEAVANLFGLSAEEVREALKSGTSLAELAEANGVSQQELTDALSESITARADKHGKELTEEQLTELREKFTEKLGDIHTRELDPSELDPADFGSRGDIQPGSAIIGGSSIDDGEVS